MLRLSAMPVAAQGQRRTDRRVRRSLCDTCVRAPEIKRLVCNDCAKEPTIKTMKTKKAVMGRRARLRCVAKGKPRPTISWSKGEVPLVSGTGAVTIRTTGSTSLLIFNPVSNAHKGRYKCIATNDVGQAEEIVFLNITRSRKRSRPTHSIESAPDRVPCQHNPCLNGGSCIYSPSLDLRRCLCTSNFEGVQCENEINSEPGSLEAAIVNRSSDVIMKHMHNNKTKAPSPVTSSTSTSVSTSTSQSSTSSTTSTSTSIRTTTTSTTSTSTTTFSTPPLRFPNTGRFLPPPSGRRQTSRTTGEIDPRFPLSRSSSLKIIPCKEKNYCKNRGKCRFIRKLNRKFCKCRGGFIGNRCENRL